MKRAVITTTIYPPDNLSEWATHMSPDDLIVVSGDVKTPHDEVQKLLDQITDLHGIETAYVVKTDTHTSHAVPMRSIQRRNVATLEAIRRGAKMITTVDTDNFPLGDGFPGGQLHAIEHMFTNPWNSGSIVSNTGWTNIGDWCQPPVTHRGWPIGKQSSYTWGALSAHAQIGVHTSLWKDDPDITALERLLTNPQVIEVPNSTLALNVSTWSPFNSQATTYRRELLPLLNVWPGVGRMDDIWPSFVARNIMDHLGYLLAFGAPNVMQERHDHDIVTDLENEIIGYRHTGTLLAAIKKIDLSGIDNALDALEISFNTLNNDETLDHVIHDTTIKFWRAWIKDLRDLQTDGAL